VGVLGSPVGLGPGVTLAVGVNVSTVGLGLGVSPGNDVACAVIVDCIVKVDCTLDASPGASIRAPTPKQ
jgi:hypothetical protein